MLLPRHPRKYNLDGISVMLIEDDFYLAADTERVLREWGATVVGPHAEANAALRSIAQRAPCCAIVDMDLGDGDRFGVASALRDKGVPFMFLTGYHAPVPPEFADARVLYKPVAFEVIVRETALLAGRR